MSDSKDYTIFIKNFDSKKVTSDLLLELFTQAGPVQHLTLKEDYAFIEFEDTESVMYACNLLNETELFGIPLQVKPRNGSKWENVDLYKFPNINDIYNNTDKRSNNNYNEYDHRPNNISPNKAYNETNYRQNNRSSFAVADQLNYRIDQTNDQFYRQQANNFNDIHHSHMQNRRLSNNYMDNNDNNWKNTAYSSNNDYQPNFGNFHNHNQQQTFNNNSYKFDRRQQNTSIGGSDRYHSNTEYLWRDKGANSSWSGHVPTGHVTGVINRSMGNTYRNRPY